jgi:hypothetical protein
VSLKDRYNRGDGRIQSFDKYLTDIGDDLGEFWWRITGVHRSVLTQGLYVVSAWAGVQHFMVTRDATMLLITCVALLSFMGIGQSKGGLVEQLQAEATGLPKNSIAFMRLLIIGIGVFSLITAACTLTASFTGELITTRAVAEPMLVGLALTALQLSDYIRRTNPATPGKGGRGKLHRIDVR